MSKRSYRAKRVAKEETSLETFEHLWTFFVVVSELATETFPLSSVFVCFKRLNFALKHFWNDNRFIKENDSQLHSGLLFVRLSPSQSAILVDF